MFLKSSYLARIVSSLVIAFLLSHLLVTYVVSPDNLVVEPNFANMVFDARLKLSSKLYEWRYGLEELSGRLFRPPSVEPRLPKPWYFVPPDDWIQPKKPIAYTPPTPLPYKTPGDIIPTVTPIQYVPRPTQRKVALPGSPTLNPFIPQPIPTVIPQPTSIPTTSPAQAPSRAAQTLLVLINDERQRQGIGTLRFDDRLNRAAQDYADIIGPAGVCSHTYESTIPQRFAAVGYPTVSGGENITCGISSPQRAFNVWMNSPGHRANMFEPSWKSAGLGFNGENRGYWVLDLGQV